MCCRLSFRLLVLINIDSWHLFARNFVLRTLIRSTPYLFFAAKGGHFDLVKWLHANDCPWDEWTCGPVAAHGDLEMLEWMLDQDCEGNGSIHYEAAAHGYLHVLKWAFINWPIDDTYEDILHTK